MNSDIKEALIDLTTAMGDMAKMIAKSAQRDATPVILKPTIAAPDVTVKAGDTKVDAPQVTVRPDIHIENPVPKVTNINKMEPPAPISWEVEVTGRDDSGYIQTMRITPVVNIG